MFLRRSTLADAGVEDGHHQDAGEEDSKGDEHSKLSEGGAIAECERDECGCGGEGSDKNAAAELF